MLDQHSKLRGTLHIFVAFDWGEEIDLDQAKTLLPTVSQTLARRKRTPSSFAYSPAPLRYPLLGSEGSAIMLDLPEVGRCRPAAEAIVFDFGGVSVSLQIPFELSPPLMINLAAGLSDPQPILDVVRQGTARLFDVLQPAIHQPMWSPLGEEYFVFQLRPGPPLPPPPQLIDEHADWLAGLVRLEDEPLSRDEVNSAVQARISYSPADLLVADWSAAVLIDENCAETLQTLEFANVQLLEYRCIDNLLDDRLSAAYSTIHNTLDRWLPFWRSQSRPLRRLGELRIDANSLFERAGNALKLMGDQYLARVYRLIAGRLHLNDWEQSIHGSLDVVERAYQVVSDQSATFRIELLEAIIVLLITFEVIMGFVR